MKTNKLGPVPKESEPFEVPKVEIKIGHAHQCKRIATAPGMSKGRDFWIGELKNPIGIETHCLHLKTEFKDITFLCNIADFQQLQIICKSVTGPINLEWMEYMIDKAKKINKTITKESIKKLGFKKVNNSMWRYKNITLQNGYVNNGGNLIERIMSERKAFKVCVDGVFLSMITNLNELNEVVEFHLK